MLPCVAAIWLVSSRREQIIRYAANPLIQAVTIAGLLVISFVPKILRTGLFLERALVPLLITALVVTTVTRPWGWLGRFLELRVLRWIGRLSYSIYLWQEIVINRPVSAGSGFAHMVALFLLRLPVVVALAMISYRWIEVPLIHLGRKLVRQMAMHSSDISVADTTVQDAVLK
jgi:peptidoglycan/LPS O-acetylase OafA/YrhL